VEELRKLTDKPDNVQYLRLDLASVKLSKEAAKEFMRYINLDLVNSPFVRIIF